MIIVFLYYLLIYTTCFLSIEEEDPLIKKRPRPQRRVRGISIEDDAGAVEVDEAKFQ